MPDSGVIQEFLASLGFKIDEPSLKKFDQALDSGGKKAKTLGTEIDKASEKVASTTTVSRFRRFTEELGKSSEMMSRFGLASAVTGATVAEEMRRIVDRYEDLFFVSQRSGASVGAINALGFGFSQVGLQAADAGKLIDQLGMKVRLNPGIRSFAEHYSGFKFDGKNTVAELRADMEAFFKMPEPVGARRAELLGVDPRTFFNWKDNRSDFDKAMAEYAKANSGADPNMAKSAHELANKMRELGLSVTALKTAIVDRLLAPLNHIADYLINLDKRTGGVSTVAIGGGGATVGAWVGWKLLKGLLPKGAEKVAEKGVPALAGDATALSWADAALVDIVGGGIPAFLATMFHSSAAGGGEDAAAEKLRQQFKTDPAGFYRAHPELRPPKSGAKMGFTPHDWYTPTPGEKKAWAAHRRNYHPSAYHPDGNPLLQNAAYVTGGRTAADDLSDWLHGNSSFVPAVRLTDQLGASLFGGAGFSGMAGSTGTTGGYGGGAPSLFPGPTAPPVGKARAALVQGLYKHLLGEGIDRDHALAILGNANAESSFDAAGAIGRAGERGLFQWLGSRLTAMHAALGGKWLDPYAEVDYAVKEQRQRDPEWFKRQGSRYGLTNDWERGFERPKNIVDRSSYTKAVENVVGALTKPLGSILSGHDAGRAKFPPWVKYNSKGEPYNPDLDHLSSEAKKRISESMWSVKHTKWADPLPSLTGARLAPSVSHHHAGDKNVTIHAPVTMHVSGITHSDAVDAMISGMRRTHGDLVRNLKGAVT